MKWMLSSALVASAAMAVPAVATPLTMTGDYLQVSISDYGTFGRNGGTPPAYVHDPLGTGTFDLSTDYISPGSPHDGFSIVASEFSWAENNNYGNSDFGFSSPTLLAGAAAMGYANAATWSGVLSGFLEVTNSYFFNPGDERVLVVTTLTALSDLTNLAFARSVDPDSGTTTSENQRGNSTLGIDDFVGSESVANGRTLALVNIDNGGYENTTAIWNTCCSNNNPYNILGHTGGDLGLTSTGDHSLNLAYRIGDLSAGSSATFKYAYAAGLGLDDIVIPPPSGAVPEPATWAMMIGGFALIGGTLRRRRTTLSFA